MKYDLSLIMRTFAGIPFAQPRSEADGSTAQVHMTLKDMLENALVNADPQEFNTGEKKYEIYRLLQRIHGAEKEVNFSVEEVATIKKVVGKNMTVTAVGAIFDALESPKANLRAVPDGEK